jgi:hypothetical protein
VDPDDLSAVRVAEKVGVPARQLCAQLLLAPANYQKVTGATVASISRAVA